MTDFLIWSAVFALPSVAVVYAWRGLFVDVVRRTKLAVACLALTSVAIVFSEAALTWVCFVKPIARQDYSLNELGLLLSLAAVVAGSSAVRSGTERPRHFGWGFSAALFMGFLDFMALLTG